MNNNNKKRNNQIHVSSPCFDTDPFMCMLKHKYLTVVISQVWIQERLPAASSKDYGNSFQSVQQHVKKNQVGVKVEAYLRSTKM